MKNSLETKIYTTAGKESGEYTLPESIFGLPWNADMMHQVIISMQSNARHGNANTKGRGDVSGGGKKPWRQKGTGRARHGSSRSPIWIGGGSSHGPKSEKDYGKKINRKMKQKALFVALSEKFRNDKVLFVTDFAADGKTKSTATALTGLTKVSGFETLTTRKPNNILVLVPVITDALRKSFRNIPFAFIDSIRQTNAADIMGYRYIVIAKPEETIALLADKKVARKTAEKTEKKAKEVKEPKVKKEKKEKKEKVEKAPRRKAAAKKVTE